MSTATKAAWQVHLPNLTGRLGKIVRIVYRVVVALTALYIIVDLPLEGVDLFRNSAAISHYGFAVKRGARGALPVTALYPSAQRAGLRVGDVVIGLNDTRLSPGATRFDLGARLDALNSAPVKLVLQDKAGLRKLALTPQTGGLGLVHIIYGMPIWAFGVVQLMALALPMLTLLCASFLLYKRKPHDGEAMLLAFSFLALIFSTSSGSWPFLYAQIPDMAPAIVAQLGTAGLCIAVAGVPDGRFPSIWGRLTVWVAGFYGVVGTALLWVPSDGLIVSALRILPEYAAILLAVIAIIVRFRPSTGIERQQIKWVLIGAVAALLIAGVPIVMRFLGLDAVMAPWLLQIVQITVFAIFHISIPIGLLIAVLAFRLYDSEAAVTHSAAYAVLSVSIIAVFAASESLVQSFGEKMVSSQLGSFSGALAAVFTAMMIAPMHARIKHAAERTFRKNLFRMREDLPPLVGDLRETTQLQPIAKVVIDNVWTGVRPTLAAIVMGETAVVMQGIDEAGVAAWRVNWHPPVGGGLQCHRADHIFPVRVPLEAAGIGRVGWLLLGPRADGSLFGRDERKALGEIADPVARALAIAATREVTASVYEDNNRALRARLAEVEATLAQLALGKAQAQSEINR